MTPNNIEPIEFNKQKKCIITNSNKFFTFPLTPEFNFIYIHNIQVNDKIASPSDLILKWRRTETTGKTTENYIKLSLHEVASVLKNNWHIYQTSENDFFKDANNFAVKGRKIEFWIEHIAGGEFEVVIYAEPLSVNPIL